MARLKKKDYEKLIVPMQVELNNLAHWLKHGRRRMVVLFEGRDTAGKGGTINAIAETLNPRQVHIVAPATPTERERYADYGRARDAMIAATHSRRAPWIVVDFNDQRRGRLNLIRHLLDHMPDCRLPETPLELPR